MRTSQTRRELLAIGVGMGLAASSLTEGRADESAAARIARIEADLGGRVGVAVLDKTGVPRLAHRAEEAFPMCSTFKAIAAAAVLARVDAGTERLGRVMSYGQADLVPYSPVTGAALKENGGSGQMSLEAVCAAAALWSDNTAGNLMLQALDGPEGLTRFFRSLGDGASRLDRNEPTLNTAIPGDPRDTTSPVAMARNLHRLLIGDALKPDSRSRLEGWMVDARTGGKRLRAGLPVGWRIGDKTGTGDNGTANVIAVLRPPGGPSLVAAIYMTGSSRPLNDRDAAHAEIGRMIAATI